jgi:hypothetical protein
MCRQAAWLGADSTSVIVVRPEGGSHLFQVKITRPVPLIVEGRQMLEQMRTAVGIA